MFFKIWSASNYNIVGSVPSTLEVRSMAVSSDLIYLGCKGGIVEVWCRKKLDRKETLQTGTNGKILCMSLDSDEEVLVTGTSDGRIQVTDINFSCQTASQFYFLSHKQFYFSRDHDVPLQAYASMSIF